MKEETGKFLCPKCKTIVKVKTNDGYSILLYKSREEKGIKRWIFKKFKNNYYYWFGDIENCNYNTYENTKDCWEETGGLSEHELDIISKKRWICVNCKYESNTVKTFLNQISTVNLGENNQLKILEKELEEEKDKSKTLENEYKEEKNKTLALEEQIKEEKNKINILSEKINLIMDELKEIKTSIIALQNK